MLTVYSTGCPKCIMAKRILKENNVPHTIEDNEDTILAVAEQNHWMMMPFGMKDGEFLNTQALFEYIGNYTGE